MCSKERVSKKRERLDLHNDAAASLSESGVGVRGGQGLQIIADQLTLHLNQGDRLCPPHYYFSLQIFRTSYRPVLSSCGLEGQNYCKEQQSKLMQLYCLCGLMHTLAKKIHTNIFDFQGKNNKIPECFCVDILQLGRKKKENGKTPSSVNVVRAAKEYRASPRKGSLLRLIQNQGNGCFYIKVIIAVPFRNNKLPLQNYWKSDYFVTFLTIVQKKREKKTSRPSVR